MNNQTLMSDLDRWAKEEVRLLPKVATCSYFSNCSAGRPLECTMSYIGRLYGEADQFRLVIVGMDHRDAEAADFVQRRAGIENYYQKGGRQFNEHYRGVVKTAVAALGNLGTYCEANCRQVCRKSRTTSAPCVLDRIAQPNVVKCVFHNVKSGTSEATRIMWGNCAHHLVSELQRLRPQLVVFHGADATWSVRNAIAAIPEAINPISDIADRSGAFVLYEWPALETRVLFLHHPSHNALNKQWNVADRALSFLRQKNLIPPRHISV